MKIPTGGGYAGPVMGPLPREPVTEAQEESAVDLEKVVTSLSFYIKIILSRSIPISVVMRRLVT